MFALAPAPGRLLCTLRGAPSIKGLRSPLTSLHIGLLAPPDSPGAPEKPLVVTVGDAAGNVLTWTLPDASPLGQPGVTEAEAAACFLKVRAHPSRPSTPCQSASDMLTLTQPGIWGSLWVSLVSLGPSLLQ